MPEDVLEGMLIPGHRLLVVNDLGPVHKGDHLVMVASVIVAVDTSRRPEDISLPSNRSHPASTSAPKRRYTRRGKNATAAITSRHLWTLVRDNQPVSSMVICDQLGLARDDLPARAKISRMLKSLTENDQIRRHQDQRTRVFRYEIADNTVTA